MGVSGTRTAEQAKWAWEGRCRTGGGRRSAGEQEGEGLKQISFKSLFC